MYTAGSRGKRVEERSSQTVAEIMSTTVLESMRQPFSIELACLSCWLCSMALACCSCVWANIDVSPEDYMAISGVAEPCRWYLGVDRGRVKQDRVGRSLQVLLFQDRAQRGSSSEFQRS